ncbi:hypothetical protein [Longimicrobium sp.]|uniref:hypothetical protein n=1 Tax=Longimicrobium sp. TaxID=2029185 RepID=UPI002CB85429|nr:hypothetical protein [Longimicrobium sp.]HSU15271.1 hypothetical protein [Longimicrobium sp.]
MMVPMLLAAALPARAAAQRYAAPSGRHAPGDTTVVFETGDAIQVSSYPRMVSGIEVCGTVGQGIHWGKMMFARTDAETNSAQESVVTFPSVGVTASCQTHRSAEGQWLVVNFSRAVRDEVGRIGRVDVGQVALPLARLQGRRVTFRWLREGEFDVGSVTPAPGTLGPPRP